MAHRRSDYFYPVFLAALGTAALVLTLVMNYYFGTTLALDHHAQIIQGASSVVIDTMVVGLALASGALVRKGKFVTGIFAGAITVAFALFSITSTVGFSASQRMAISAKAEIAKNNANELATAKTKDAQSVRDETLKWLQNTAVNAVSRREREGLYSSIAELATKPIDIVGTQSAADPTDMQAVAISNLMSRASLSVKPSDVQLFMAIALGVLLISGKAFCFWLASYLWPTAPIAAAAAPTVRVTQNSRALRSQDEDGEDELPPRPSQLSFREEDEDIALTAALKPDVEMIQAMRETVSRFLAECTRPARHSRVTANDVYNCYVAWAQRNGEEQVLTQNRFGRICTSLQVARDPRDNRRAWYVGLELIKGVEEAALDEAA